MEDVYEANIAELQRDLAGDFCSLKNLRASVRYGTVRAGHGLEIRLAGEDNRWVEEGSATGPGGYGDGLLDVHGDAVFQALGGLGGVARMMLPLKIRLMPQPGGAPSDRPGWRGASSRNRRSERLSPAPGESESRQGGAYRALVVLGAHKLSHARIDTLLADMVSAGDTPFVLEFRGPEEDGGKRQLLGFVPTRASLVQRGLADDAQSVVHRGPIPPMRRHPLSRIIPTIRWWLCPLLFALWCWALLLEPAAILSRVPGVISKYDNVTTVLPLHPRSMEQAFQLGVLHERLRASSGSALGEASGASILQEAEAVVGKGRGTVRIEELQNVLAEIQRIEASRGLTSRVAGFFTFVNIMWVLAIAGMTVSIGPSIYSLLWPLRDFLRRMWSAFLDNILRPAVTRLHRWGVLELAAYSVCMLLVAEGHRVSADGGEAGLYISLTGAVGCIPCFAYSTSLWAPRTSPDKDALAHVAQVWLMICWVPCAVALDSTLYGYLAVVALFGALEFSVVVGHLVWYIGFKNRASLQRAATCSFLMVTSFAAARLWGVEQAYMLPFAQPVQVFGSVVGLLAMLIASGSPFERTGDYWRSNVVMVLALLFTQLVGRVWGMVGMANVGTTFTVLWLMDKYAMLHKNMGFNFYVLVLLNSTFVWRASLYLHMHPEFVTRMMTL